MPDTSVKVVCRFRPPNERELQENTDAKAAGTALDFLDATSLQVTQPGTAPQLFTFDRVFHSDSSQIEVFESTIRDTIDDVIQGYNGTIFAYGQTGAGKSFSMFGPDISEEEKMGIIPRACRHIFQYISQCTDGTEFTIKCSFLEIYKEIIKDLLNPKNSNLKIRESPQRGVWVEGLTELFVTCEQDVLDLIRMGERFRKVAFTKMNATSSRSHSLFILQLMQKSPDGSTKTGKLNLADLAGSEKISKTGATGETLEEAKKINLSLSALGNCINALSTRQKHIPYRDSTLTFVLRESLGGNSKTTLLIACSPHVFNMEETVSTLRFGQRAKSIKLNVKVNQQRSVAELEMLVAQLQRDLNKLRFYTRRLEEELRLARGADFDLDAFRKRIMLDYREEGEEPSSPSTPSTPTKSALMSPPTSAPGTPMSPRGASSFSGLVPPSPGVDYLDPMALAESRLAYEKMKQQLEFKIQDLTDEVKMLKDNASEESKETIKELEEQMQELRSEGDKLAYELNQKDLEMESLLSELAASKDRAAEMERQAARANEQILALQAANDALTHEKAQLSSTIKSLQESLQSSKNQLTLLEHTASQHGREKESIQSLLREREDQYRALQQQLIEIRAQNDDLLANEEEVQLQLRLMRQEKEVVDAALSSARSRLASLETTSQEKQEKVVVISENADKLRDDNSILMKKLATLEAEHEKMRADMRNKDQQLQSERAKSKQQADALRQASAQLREKQLELQSLQLESSVKLSQADNDLLNERNLRLLAEKELERTRRLLEEKEKIESSLSENLSKSTKELQQERTKSGVQAKQIQESARRISDLDRELNVLRTENRSLREDLGLDPSETYKGNNADGKNGSSDSTGNVDVVAEVRQWLGRVRRRSSLAVPVMAGSSGATTPQSSNNVAVPVGQQSARDFLASARAAGQTGASTTSPGTSSNDTATGNGGDVLTTPFSSSSSSRSSLSGFFVSSGSSASGAPEKKAAEESKTGTLTILEGTTWTVRFCIAQGSKLRIYADRKSQSTVLSEMNLAGMSLFRADKFSKKPNSFGLGLKAGPEAKFFVAQNDDACDEWIQFLTTSCGLPIVS